MLGVDYTGSARKINRYDKYISEGQKKAKIEHEGNVRYWNKKLNNIVVARKISTLSKDKEISRETLNDTYNFIVKLFISKGFDEEEAVKYINSNVDMLFLSKTYIGCVLAVLGINNLDETAMFERPDFILKNRNLSKIYGSMRGLKSEEKEVSLEKIESYSKENPEKTSEYAAKLTKSRLQVLYCNYTSKLEKEVERVL